MSDTATDSITETVSDADLLQMVASLFDGRRWRDIVDLTDAYLEARGELPGSAAHFRAAGLQGVGRFGEAVPWAEMASQAIRQPLAADDPASTPYFAALIGLGQAYAITGAHAQAMQTFRAALKVPLTNPDSLASQAHLRLAIKPGQWRRGWRDHEQRVGSSKAPRIPGPTVWDGGPTDGPVVVLHEQGIGDAVLFSRWLPWIAERSGHPVIWVGERMFQRWAEALPGVGQWMALPDIFREVSTEHGDQLELTHGACFMRSMSAPFLADCTVATIPAPVAPVLPRPFSLPGKLRVGYCWRGSSGAHHDFDRSLPDATAAQLFTDSPLEVVWQSLQHNTPVPEGWPLEPMGAGDLLETFQTVADCDIVVTVDTSIAHIAGSLGRPTLVLPPLTVDWRYMGWPTGSATPWYPSQVIIRRRSAFPDDVALQVQMARATLEALVARLTA